MPSPECWGNGVTETEWRNLWSRRNKGTLIQQRRDHGVGKLSSHRHLRLGRFPRASFFPTWIQRVTGSEKNPVHYLYLISYFLLQKTERLTLKIYHSIYPYNSNLLYEIMPMYLCDTPWITVHICCLWVIKCTWTEKCFWGKSGTERT